MRNYLATLLVFGASLAYCQLSPKVIQYEGVNYGCFTPEQGVVLYNSIIKANAYDSTILLLDVMESQIKASNDAYVNLYASCEENYNKYDKIIKIDDDAIKYKDEQIKQVNKHLKKRNIIDIVLVGLLVIAVL